jgi:hypothetical protein
MLSWWHLKGNGDELGDGKAAHVKGKLLSFELMAPCIELSLAG